EIVYYNSDYHITDSATTTPTSDPGRYLVHQQSRRLQAWKTGTQSLQPRAKKSLTAVAKMKVLRSRNKDKLTARLPPLLGVSQYPSPASASGSETSGSGERPSSPVMSSGPRTPPSSPFERPPSPTPFIENIAEEVRETLEKTEHPAEPLASDDENIGSVSDEENAPQDQNVSQEFDDGGSESTNYLGLSPRRPGKVSLSETDELLLNYEDGHSIISDIFDEASPQRSKFGSRLFSPPYSSVRPQFSKEDRPQFSTKAYHHRRTHAIPSSPRDYQPIGSVMIKTPVGYYLDDDEAELCLALPRTPQVISRATGHIQPMADRDTGKSPSAALEREYPLNEK
ncbi:hypothetical protein BaRGS_00006947, partial [Batillaria attramentaria]